MSISNNQSDSMPLLLLVENDQPSRDVVKIFLKNICEIEFAVNAEEALEKVNSAHYDLILMDINLGKGMNGIELTRQIRNETRYEKTPIIALTAYAMAGDKEKFIAAGCTHYVSKPFDKLTLTGLIKNIINGAN
ncbi:MAG: response regulator [Ignavibacteriaceae bacterium]|jgi:CheY-like chemotaxis protein